MPASTVTKKILDNVHWLLIIFSVLCNLLLAVVLFYFVVLSPKAGAQPNQITSDTWSTNGTVYDIAVGNDGTVYLGGNFSYVGPTTGYSALINLSEGEVVETFPTVLSTGSSNFVRKVIPDGSGGWYVGGSFTSVDGVARTGLARINADGTLNTAFYPNLGTSYTVYSLLLNEGVLYVGGFFSSVNSESRYGLVALSPTTGGTNSDFTPALGNSFSTVYGMTVDSGLLYVVGNFSSIGGENRNSIAAIDLGDSSVTSWNPDAGNFSFVYDIAVSSTLAYVGGGFSSIGGQSRSYLAAIDTATGEDTGWNPDPSGYVYSLDLNGPDVYISGSFITLGADTRNYLGAVNGTTGAATSWHPVVNGTVYDFVISDDTVYIVGGFTTVGGSSRARLASVSKTTGEVGSLSLPASATAYTVAINENNLYVGGDFTSVGGVLRNNLAALDGTTGQATSWDPNVNGNIRAVELGSSVLYIGGTFSQVAGSSRSRLAAVNLSDGSLTSWNPNAGGFAGVTDIELDGTTLYVAGGFNSIGGDTRNQIAAISTVSASSTPWNPSLSGGFGGLNTIAVSSTVVYVGGDFTSVGGDSISAVAAIDRTTGSSTGWDPAPAVDFSSPIVNALAVDGSVVYVGGKFTTIGGASRNYLAAIDGSTGLATDWNPNPTMVCGMCDRFTRILPTSSLVYVAGSFTSIGGGSGNRHLAALDSTTGLATSWVPNIPASSEPVKALTLYNSVLYIGGSFTAVGSSPAVGLAQFGPIKLGFASTTMSALESVTSTSFTVGITNGVTSTQAITVGYSATGGTASGSGVDYTLTAGTATISAGQTSTTIPLTVIADTSLESDETLVITLANPVNARLSTSNSVTYTILNDDTVSAGVTVSESASSTVLSESGTTDTYTVVLNSEPSASVTIALTTSTQVSASPATLTFTTVNWETPQTVTVTAVNDNIAEGSHTGSITHTATSADDDYDGVVVSSVVATITDNDTAGITLTQSSGTTEVSEGGLSDTFSLVLTSQPTSTVTITLPTLTDLSFSTSSIAFTASNWSSVQTITMSAVNDAIIESTETATVTFSVSSSDSNYNNYSISSFLASILDNDTEGSTSSGGVAAPPALPAVTVQPTPQIVETKTLSESTPVTIQVGGSSHSISLISHSFQSATIVIRSEPLVVTVTNGIPSEVDIDRDGKNDLRVVYLGEIAGLPEFEFITLSDSSEKDKPISINQGAYSTQTREVQVQLNAKGVISVALSHTPDFGGIEFQPYQSTLSWLLPDGAGEKKVYARLRSATGGFVDVSDSIIYDPSSVLAGSCPVESGRAYREYGKKDVYYVLDKNSEDRFKSLFSCTKRLFQTPEVYFSYFDSWDDTQLVDSVVLKAIPDDDVSFIPWGPKHRVKDGSLLKTITDPKVYFILGPSRHWVASGEVFNSLNFVWDSVQDSAGSLVERFKPGKDIVTPTDVPPGTFIRYSSSTDSIYFLQQDPNSPTSTWKRPVQKTSLIRRVLKAGTVITLPPEVVFPDGPVLK